MVYSPAGRALAWLTARPIAHRGLHGPLTGTVENTSSAFAAAIARNYVIELDIQLSSDNVAMVYHDDRLDRLNAASGPVRSRTARQLQATAFKSSPDKMQTLAQLLGQVAGQVPLLIELKSLWDGNTTLAASAIAALDGYGGPCALMSFDPDLMEAVRYLAPHIPRGIVASMVNGAYWSHLPLARKVEMRTLSHMPRTRPDFLSYYETALPSLAASRQRARGMPLISWTIRSHAQARRARCYSDQITFEGFYA